MPPRYSYWTILAGGLPTAFRAAEREDLLPTFNRIREKHPDAEMKWFARGRLWQSPDEAQADLERARIKRDRDWRPGGDHRAPRQTFKTKRKQDDPRREKTRRRPSSEPTVADTRPTGPASKPGAPRMRPTGPAWKSGAPHTRPTGPAAKSGAPHTRPTGPGAKSGPPRSRTTGPAATSGAPPRRPTGPAAKSGAPPTRPTGTASKFGSPHRRGVGPPKRRPR